MVEPIFDRDGVTLFCADANAVIPQLPTYDLLLTDPLCGGLHNGSSVAHSVMWPSSFLWRYFQHSG